MLRFLLEKLRNTKGPLAGPRVIAADLAEELLDLAEHYVKKAKQSEPEESTVTSYAQPVNPTSVPGEQAVNTAPAAVSKEERVGEEVKEATTSKAKPAVKTSTVAKAKKAAKPKTVATKEPVATKVSITVSDELKLALDNPKFSKKQDFKILAILWHAKQIDLGVMTAKDVASHGERIGLTIRHENVRKVIRLRLENFVEVSHPNAEAGSSTINHYQISPNGLNHFEETYLNTSS